MKQLKGVVFVLAGLFLMITLVSLLMPSKVMTVRSVVIHSDSKSIISQVNDLSNWKHWHPVFSKDSNAIKISNPSYGVNAYASWNPNGVETKLLITEAGATHIKASIMRPGEKDVINIISVNPVSDSTAMQVEWRALTTLRWYPWEKFYGIFVDKLTGPGYDTALNNLRLFMEEKK